MSKGKDKECKSIERHENNRQANSEKPYRPQHYCTSLGISTGVELYSGRRQKSIPASLAKAHKALEKKPHTSLSLREIMKYNVGHDKANNGGRAVAKQHNKMLTEESFYQCFAELLKTMKTMIRNKG